MCNSGCLLLIHLGLLHLPLPGKHTAQKMPTGVACKQCWTSTLVVAFLGTGRQVGRTDWAQLQASGVQREPQAAYLPMHTVPAAAG